jgi:hypothetical protein
VTCMSLFIEYTSAAPAATSVGGLEPIGVAGSVP